MDGFVLKTELRQDLKLTPQLMQSMEILQMNSQELLDYINRTAEENPLLECEDLSSVRTDYEELCQKISWLDVKSGPVIGSASADEYAVADNHDDLASFVRDQLDRRHLSKPLLALTNYLAESLDENGWLAQEDLDALAGMNIPDNLIAEALEILQTLEPAGIGARSLSECLLLQLKRQEKDSDLLRELVARFLPNLANKQYGPIRKELNVTTEEIAAAEAIIAALDPYPGRTFQPEEVTRYLRPDIFVAELDGKLQAILNEYYLPRISISDYYRNLLKSEQDSDTLVYLRQKLQQANGLLNGLERRNNTLQRCADAILARQYGFFAQKTQSLQSMTLVALAEELSLHPSTVSRATRGKYLQCRQGTFPLRYFFSRTLRNSEISVQHIRQRIYALIKDEDPKHPLSDQKLCALLEKEGIYAARRTVAKYRVEMGFGSSVARNGYKNNNIARCATKG